MYIDRSYSSIQTLINMKLHYNTSKFFLLVCLILHFSLLSAAKSECDMEEETEENKSLALRLKIAAIFSILFSSFLGVIVPIFGQSYRILNPTSNLFFVLKAFAGGVLLAVGFIHILPESFERLGSDCLSEKPWHLFPFAGFIAMLSAIGTLMIDSFASGYFKRIYARNNDVVDGVDVNDTKVDEESNQAVYGSSHAHAHAPIPHPSKELIRYRVISQVNIIRKQTFSVCFLVVKNIDRLLFKYYNT